jgi:hypothetical protein
MLRQRLPLTYPRTDPLRGRIQHPLKIGVKSLAFTLFTCLNFIPHAHSL